MVCVFRFVLPWIRREVIIELSWIRWALGMLIWTIQLLPSFNWLPTASVIDPPFFSNVHHVVEFLKIEIVKMLY